MRSMLLRNNHIRAIDRFFDTALGNGHSPFAIMDKVLDSVTQPIPPADGSEMTIFRMVPTRYRVEHQPDGSVHYNIVGGENESTDEKPEAA